MLRLKRDIDIDKLEKEFNIIQSRYDATGEITLGGEDFSGWVEIDGFVDKKHKYTCFDEEDLFDLIKADFIEKVKDGDNNVK